MFFALFIPHFLSSCSRCCSSRAFQTVNAEFSSVNSQGNNGRPGKPGDRGAAGPQVRDQNMDPDVHLLQMWHMHNVFFFLIAGCSWIPRNPRTSRNERTQSKFLPPKRHLDGTYSMLSITGSQHSKATKKLPLRFIISSCFELKMTARERPSHLVMSDAENTSNRNVLDVNAPVKMHKRQKIIPIGSSYRLNVSSPVATINRSVGKLHVWIIPTERSFK